MLQMELSSVISGLLEQWGGHLKKCSDRAALRFLKSFLSENKSKSFVTIIVSPEYDEKTLIPLLEILARHSSTAGLSAGMYFVGAGDNKD